MRIIEFSRAVSLVELRIALNFDTLCEPFYAKQVLIKKSLYHPGATLSMFPFICSRF